MSESPEERELRAVVRAYLMERYVMALGSHGAEGLWVASVYFAPDLSGETPKLYFLSSPNSRHGRNIASNAEVSAAINEDEHDWQAIRGIQLEGRCEPVRTPREYLRAWRAYVGKFPFVRDLFRGSAKLDAGMTSKLLRTQMYALTVERLFYLDNRRGFGRRREVTVRPSNA
jgi:uncharacterized protein YhbP (UPF0306 family)